jgi:uncharacterized protein (TIGR00299 family) protein
MKIAYFDCFSGISGDMTLGALVDLGLDPEFLESELKKLKLEGYKLSFHKAQKHGITGTKANVELTEHENQGNVKHDHDHEHSHDHVETPEHKHTRNLSDIRQLIANSDLGENIKAITLSIFTRLGEAEAKIHGVTIDEVYFHEVGAVDSIVDIVGSVIGIYALGIERIYSSPLSLGRGMSKSSHGVIPIPAPATLELLKGLPVKQTEIKGELVTPTGAAIISTLAESFGQMPEMVIDKISYGAGFKDLQEQPNMLRICLGHTTSNFESDTIIVVETNIDDMSPQIYDLLIDKLLAIGALDVFLTPIVMKKSRPATKLTVLVEQPNLQKVYECILTETTTMGVRIYKTDRKKLAREMVEVETEYGIIRVKLGKIGDKIIKVLPEYDDCKRLSIEKGIPLMKIQHSVLMKFMRKR